MEGDRPRYTVEIGGPINKSLVPELRKCIQAFFEAGEGESSFDANMAVALSSDRQFMMRLSGKTHVIYADISYEAKALSRLCVFLARYEIASDILMEPRESGVTVDLELDMIRPKAVWPLGYKYMETDGGGNWAIPQSRLAAILYNYAVSSEVCLRALKELVPPTPPKLQPISFV